MVVKKVGLVTASKKTLATLDPKILVADPKLATTRDTFIQVGYVIGDQQKIVISDHENGLAPANGPIKVPTGLGPSPPPPRIDPALQLRLIDTIDIAGTDVAVELYLRFVPEQQR